MSFSEIISKEDLLRKFVDAQWKVIGNNVCLSKELDEYAQILDETGNPLEALRDANTLFVFQVVPSGKKIILWEKQHNSKFEFREKNSEFEKSYIQKQWDAFFQPREPDSDPFYDCFDLSFFGTDFQNLLEKFRKQIMNDLAGTLSKNEKTEIALLLQLRLIFIFLLQKKGWFKNNPDFFGQILLGLNENDWYESFFIPLMEILAIPEDDKNRLNPRYHSVKDTPFLNGGLFRNRATFEIQFKSGKPLVELIKFFNTLDWSLDESEGGVLTPEVLGVVFERTVTQREIGAYYTPITLTAHVTRLAIEQDFRKRYGITTPIKNFITNPANTKLLTEIISDDTPKSIFNIKILDPAVGSGAFLLSILSFLTEICMQISKTLQRPVDPFEIKKKIILRNLYGVDIEPSAVEICKLRLWLSLIIEEAKPVALPSIDFNIRTGDSLIGLHANESALDSTQILEYARLISAFKQAQWLSNADRIKKEDDLQSKIAKLKGSFDAICTNQYAQLGTYQNFFQGKMGDLEKFIAKYQDLFHWYIEFFDVFETLGGFDIIIGNPPWGADRVKEPLMKPALTAFFGDVWCENSASGFLCRSIRDLLKTGGLLYFVLPAWISTLKIYTPIRKFLLQYKIWNILDLGAPIFSGASDVDVMIFSMEKTPVPDDFFTQICYLRPFNSIKAKLRALNDKNVNISCQEKIWEKICQNRIIFNGSPRFLSLFHTGRQIKTLNDGVVQVKNGLGTRHDLRFTRFPGSYPQELVDKDVFEYNPFGPCTSSKPCIFDKSGNIMYICSQHVESADVVEKSLGSVTFPVIDEREIGLSRKDFLCLGGECAIHLDGTQDFCPKHKCEGGRCEIVGKIPWYIGNNERRCTKHQHEPRKKWAWYAQGTNMQPYFLEIKEKVVNWERNGLDIKYYYWKVPDGHPHYGKPRSRIQNEKYYFREALTFKKIWNRKQRFYVALIGDNCIPCESASGIYLQKDCPVSINFLYGFLNSSIANQIRYSLNNTLQTQVGDVLDFPLVLPTKQADAKIAGIVAKILHDIEGPVKPDWFTRKEFPPEQQEIDQIVLASYHLTPEDFQFNSQLTLAAIEQEVKFYSGKGTQTKLPIKT